MIKLLSDLLQSFSFPTQSYFCFVLFFFLSKIHFVDALACVFSDVPLGHRVFRFIHPHPGDPAGVDQVLTCVPVADDRSALFNQSHLVAFSAALLADLITLLLAAPVMPNRLRTLQRERPAKPLWLTSMGSKKALQLLSLHYSTSF